MSGKARGPAPPGDAEGRLHTGPAHHTSTSTISSVAPRAVATVTGHAAAAYVEGRMSARVGPLVEKVAERAAELVLVKLRAERHQLRRDRSLDLAFELVADALAADPHASANSIYNAVRGAGARLRRQAVLDIVRTLRASGYRGVPAQRDTHAGGHGAGDE